MVFADNSNGGVVYIMAKFRWVDKKLFLHSGGVNEEPSRSVSFGSEKYYNQLINENGDLTKVHENIEAAKSCLNNLELSDNEIDGYYSKYVRNAIESLHEKLLEINNAINNKNTSEDINKLKQKSEQVRNELEELSFKNITYKRNGSGPFIPIKSKIWSNSLGQYVNLISQFAKDGPGSFVLDDNEVLYLHDIAMESDNSQIRLLFSRLIAGGTGHFITRYGNNTDFVDDYSITVLSGGNLCLNMSEKTQELPCSERGLYDYYYEVDPVNVEPSKLPSISDALKVKYLKLIKDKPPYKTETNSVGILKILKKDIANIVIFNELVEELFEDAVMPQTALVYETALFNMVALEPSLDRQTKQYYGKIITVAAAVFNKNFRSFSKDKFSKSPKDLWNSGYNNEDLLNLENISCQVRYDLRAALDVIEHVGKWMHAELTPSGAADKLAVVLCKTGDCAETDLVKVWKQAFLADVYPSSDLRKIESFIYSGANDFDVAVDSQSLPFSISYLEHLHHIFVSKKGTSRLHSGFERDQNMLEAAFSKYSSMDVYDAFLDAPANDWHALIGFLVGMSAGGYPKAGLATSIGSFGVAMLAGVVVMGNDKANKAIDVINETYPVPLPEHYKVEDEVEKSKEPEEQSSFIPNGEITIDPADWNKSISNLPEGDRFALETNDPITIDCQNEEGCFVYTSMQSTPESFIPKSEFGNIGKTFVAGTTTSPAGGKMSIGQKIGKWMPVCESLFATAAIGDYVWLKMVMADADQSVNPFYIGIDENGEFIKQTPLQLGSYVHGLGYSCCNSWFVSCMW